MYLLHKKERIDWKLAIPLMIPMALGSSLAAFVTISLVKKGWVEAMLGILLLVAGILLLLQKNFGLRVRAPRFSRRHFRS